MILRNKYIFLFLFISCGCTTLNKALIENSERIQFDPLVLIPDYDIYNIRIDIIRQTSEVRVNDSTKESKKAPYHLAGFYLGNGLFIDLNDNISLLVPKLFDINRNQNFIVEREDNGYFFKSVTTYEKTDQAFIIHDDGLFSTNTKTEIENNNSAVFIKDGLFSHSKILRTDSSFTVQYGWDKTTIFKNAEGYYYRTLFGKEAYKQIHNEIFIGKRYIIRNLGDRIDILCRGLLYNEILKYRMIKTGNRIYVYDQYYTGLEIIKTGNEMEVWENKNKLCSYTLK